MTPLDFIYRSTASRVVFGAGALQHLERELDLLSSQRALVLCTPEQSADAQALMDRLGPRAAGCFARATMHVPIEVVRQAMRMANELSVDSFIALGGGSTIGLAKAMVLRKTLPTLAIPTTYAGSEMTNIYGMTEAERKLTGRDDKVLPKTVIYDPLLTVSLPVEMSATSGLNAIAHCVEALYAVDGNPIVALLAQEGMGALAGGLRQVIVAPADVESRARCQYGAWLAGIALNSSSVALHHKLCHVLGGTLNLPHAATHAIVLPYVVAYNTAYAPDAMRAIERALGCSEAAVGLYELASCLGAPFGLRSLGVQRDQLDLIAELAVQSPYPNPRPLEREALRALLQQAYAGEPPRPIE